jgi:hypothetical protein
VALAEVIIKAGLEQLANSAYLHLIHANFLISVKLAEGPGEPLSQCTFPVNIPEVWCFSPSPAYILSQ